MLLRDCGPADVVNISSVVAAFSCCRHLVAIVFQMSAGGGSDAVDVMPNVGAAISRARGFGRERSVSRLGTTIGIS